MATVLATCAHCGDVEVPVDDVTVRADAGDGPGEFAFTCPVCGRRRVKHVAPRVIDLLAAAGADLVPSPPRRSRGRARGRRFTETGREAARREGNRPRR